MRIASTSLAPISTAFLSSKAVNLSPSRDATTSGRSDKHTANTADHLGFSPAFQGEKNLDGSLSESFEGRGSRKAANSLLSPEAPLQFRPVPGSDFIPQAGDVAAVPDYPARTASPSPSVEGVMDLILRAILYSGREGMEPNNTQSSMFR